LEVYHARTQEQAKEDREYAQEKRVEDARKLSAVSEPLRAVYTRGPPHLPHDPRTERPLLFATLGNPLLHNDVLTSIDFDEEEEDTTPELPAERQPAKTKHLMSVLRKKGQSATPPPLEKVVTAPKQVVIAPKQVVAAPKQVVIAPKQVVAAPKQVVTAPKQVVADPKAVKQVMAGAKASNDDHPTTPTYSPMREGQQ
jgi:hypothetical protein